MKPFEVTILGSGAAIPTLQRNPSSQFINCNDRYILIDCGEGTQHQLRKFGVKFQKINHILISHLHGDHFFGLVGLLSSMHLLGRDVGIIVYGPEELEFIVRSQLEIGGAKLNFSVTFIVLNGKEYRLLFEDNRIEIWAFPLNHRIPTNGFRINEKPHEFQLDGDKFKESDLSLTYIPAFKKGIDIELQDGTVYLASDYTFPPKETTSYAYCSDTLYDEKIIPYIEGVNVLYHEATFLEDMKQRAKETMHSTAIQAATIAKKANVDQLLLGHLSARYTNSTLHEFEAKTIFENCEVVEDGKVYRVN